MSSSLKKSAEQFMTVCRIHCVLAVSPNFVLYINTGTQKFNVLNCYIEL